MAVFYCEECDKFIDMDYDAEHYDLCPTIDNDGDAFSEAREELRQDWLQSEMGKQ